MYVTMPFCAENYVPSYLGDDSQPFEGLSVHESAVVQQSRMNKTYILRFITLTSSGKSPYLLLQSFSTNEINWRLHHLSGECQLGIVVRHPYFDISSSRPVKEHAPASRHSSTTHCHFISNALNLASIDLLPIGWSDASRRRKLGRQFWGDSENRGCCLLPQEEMMGDQ